MFGKRLVTNLTFVKFVLNNGENDLVKYHQGQQSIKLPFAIYVDFKTILKKTSSCENNPKIPLKSKTHCFRFFCYCKIYT